MQVFCKSINIESMPNIMTFFVVVLYTDELNIVAQTIRRVEQTSEFKTSF